MALTVMDPRNAVIENMNDLIDIERAARLIGMSVSWLRKQTQAGLFPCYRTGRRVRFAPAQLAKWLDSQLAEVR